jgi:signal peptidase I
MKRATKKILWTTLIVVIVVVVGVPLTIIKFYSMPAGSMIPTVSVGDRMLVNRLSYAFGGEPQRGDVIVFVYPQDETKEFVKRIVAVGGDRVSWKGQEVRINGKPIRRRRLKQPCSYDDTTEDGHTEKRGCILFEERLDDRSYRVIQDLSSMPMPDIKPIAVPAGHVYVLGDNRDNSHDSRFWGTVPRESIVGRVLVD